MVCCSAPAWPLKPQRPPLARLVLCVVNISPNKILQILFPVFIAFLVPVRAILPLWFREEDIAYLDAGEDPDVEDNHWL